LYFQRAKRMPSLGAIRPSAVQVNS
jgi:hypothetical protein